ncbi:MAG: N-acetylgalactosamine-6-sulfatase, partial [Planctomycetota bacterium]|nr:N-acetylgalactosamine-6-sulfatase [Planctomycetota bacterium]
TVNRKSVFAAIDLAPSLLQISGVTTGTDVTFDGEPLGRVITGKSKASRNKPVFFRRPPDRDAFYGDDDLPDLAIRNGNWKLLCEYDGTDAELFDLNADPSETLNLAEENPAIVDQLTRQVIAWHKHMPADNGATYKEKRRQ